MADDLSLSILTDPFTTWHKHVLTNQDRATMWALREVGRRVKREAAKRAPVYKGDDPRAVKGQLKKAIHSSKRFRKPTPHSYSITVSPLHGDARLYAAKIEATTNFMHAGLEATLPDVAELHAKAWGKAMNGKAG